MTETADIVAFLAARLDEEECIARDVTADDWGDEPGCSSLEWEDLPDSAFTHAKRHGPARVLREVAFKRAILGQYRTAAGWSSDNWPVSLRLLVAIWNDHPDYRPEWAPGDETP